jgi:hypothetical protein
MTDFSLNLTSQRKPEAIADGYPVSAIFPDVSIRSHRLWRPRGIPLPSPGPSRERRRNPRSSQARIVPSSELSGESCALQRRNSLAFPHCDEPASRGGDPVWWGKSDGYRRYARGCLEMASVRLARFRPRAWTRPAPSRAGYGGGARSRPVRPGAGIPRQSDDIVRTGSRVATTRPPAHAFRMHARHAEGNRHPWPGFAAPGRMEVSQAIRRRLLRRPERARR